MTHCLKVNLRTFTSTRDFFVLRRSYRYRDISINAGKVQIARGCFLAQRLCSCRALEDAPLDHSWTPGVCRERQAHTTLWTSQQ